MIFSIRKLAILVVLLCGIVSVAPGCKKKAEPATDAAGTAGGHEGHNHEGHEGHDHHHEGHDHDASAKDANDPRANHELTPPIEISEVPDGAWYCDMGTSHYYQNEKGDGKCPVCGMLLKQKVAK